MEDASRQERGSHARADAKRFVRRHNAFCKSTLRAGAMVQASGFRLHEHFNHNDLYHVIQMVALVLLYRGAKRLQSS